MSPSHVPDPDGRRILSLSPEARRHQSRVANDGKPALRPWLIGRIGPRSRIFEVLKRTFVGTYNDGFIHAGNLAYLSMLAIFPFFILGSALASLFGGAMQRQALVDAVVSAMPPTVAATIAPVAEDVIQARTGWLLWVGALVALWTVSSLIETIRDILRRAYGTEATHAFWKYRLGSVILILLAVVLLILSLMSQLMLVTAQELIANYVPDLADRLTNLQLSRIVPAVGLAGSLYLVFYTLTPSLYRSARYPKWPGALFTTLWWLGVSSALPPVLQIFFTYNLTYASLAGVMVALFFFWLVGLGVVIGAELNAALAVHPDEQALDREGKATETDGVDEQEEKAE